MNNSLNHFLKQPIYKKVCLFLIIFGVIGILIYIFLLSNKLSTPVAENALPPVAIKEPTQPVTLTGTFNRSLEQSELIADNKTYHVFDPKNLLDTRAKSIGQKGVSVSFPVCIKGRISEKGNFGHLGKHPFELWVDEICN